MITISLAGKDYELMKTAGTDTDYTRRLRESLEDAQGTIGAEILAALRRSLVLDVCDNAAIDGAYIVKTVRIEPAPAPAAEAPASAD